jgi:hypothetical protein
MQEHRGVFVSGNREGNEMISSLSMVEMIEFNEMISVFVSVGAESVEELPKSN